MKNLAARILAGDPRALARAASAIENGDRAVLSDLPAGQGLVVGVTGPPGAGKSTLVDGLAAEWRRRGKTVAIVAVDPSSAMSGGAILGDRIRMQQHHADPGIFIRSMASRGARGGLADATAGLVDLFSAAGRDVVVVETVGVGQADLDIAAVARVTVVVLVPGLGDDVQALKAGILEIADIFVINKSDHPGAEQLEIELHMERTAPVVRTVATEETGIPQLADAIAAVPVRQAAPRRGLSIDHLGIAVKSIDTALEFYAKTLGMRLGLREKVEQEGVEAAMLPAGGPRLELLEPLDADSVIGKFIAKRGEGLHHVALRVPDLPAAVARLRTSGARILNEPRKGAGGHLYVFVHPASTGGVLLELIQE